MTTSMVESGPSTSSPASIKNNKEPPSESQRITSVGKYLVVGLDEDDEAFYNAFTTQQRRKVRTKIDIRLLPVLCILYMFSQLDRSNIGNAKIEGLKVDLGLTDTHYNLILAIFFVPYCLFEVPSNMIVKRLERPSRYIAFLVVAWGTAMTLHGCATGFGSLLSLRFMLGVAEAGYYPAALFLCSQWYRPHELAGRLSLFMACAAIAGITSGLLAAAIAQMDGICGLAGWRWLFIVEGTATIVAGIVTAFALVDTPRLSSSWLEPDEIRYLEIQAFIKNGGNVANTSAAKDLWSLMRHWRYWAWGIMALLSLATDYGLRFSIPAMLVGMGYTKRKSQFLSTIPYIFGLISTIALSVGSDLLACRSIFITSAFISATIGFGVIFGHITQPGNHSVAVIVGMCMVTFGTFPMNPTVGSWISNNIATSHRRAVGLAFVNMVGSFGGLVGSFVFTESEAPYFSIGLKTSMGFSVAGLLLCWVIAGTLWHENYRKEKEKADAENRAFTQLEMLQMGENSPLFRNTL
ncbi:putative MFS transporter [Stachybotrys elegans]|uniref:MFS transporter n=1 Tax=Stachybotrys elegans TaxID=80388 RepID=A0A8K0WXM4_9HYPO|nr:putative MFS transporter [Stachybotrys elegans]